jgi:MFS transporter, DHA1 family, inner membrane transport protein
VRLRHELEAFKNVQVLLAMVMTMLGFGGVSRPSPTSRR